MLKRAERENRIVLIFTLGLFLVFLAAPLALIAVQSFRTASGAGLGNYSGIFTQGGFFRAFGNSLLVSLCSGALSTALAFLLAYSVHCTNLPGRLKRAVAVATGIPMLLPTITYGFAIIYTYDRQGLFFRLFGGRNPQIYGFNGLVFGYVVYTLPIAFMLLDNGFRYIDKQFVLVSQVMGDRPLRTFFTAILRPLAGTLGTALVQSFFLSFTDFGIPASIGGQYSVVATVLYDQMLGAAPDFGRGSAVAIMMLIPSAVSIFLLDRLGRSGFRYNRISEIWGAKDHPDVPVILAHAGSESFNQQARLLAMKLDNVFLEPSWCGTNAVKHMIADVGCSKIMFSSDNLDQIPVELAKYRQIVKNEDDLEDVMWRNANRIFRLGL